METGLILILLGIVFVGIGILLIKYSQKTVEVALKANDQTKEEVASIQKGVEIDDANAKAEEQKQADIQKAADEEKAKNVTKDDVLDFFNKPTDK